MAEIPRDLPDETTPPEETPLLVAEALAEISGMPLSEFEGLTSDQLNMLFDNSDLNENLFSDPSKTEEVQQKNAEILRRKISEMRTK